MGDEMLETLAVVKRLRSASASQVSSDLVIFANVTAVNNRLEDLRALGFVARTRNGKSWLYTPTGKRAR